MSSSSERLIAALRGGSRSILRLMSAAGTSQLVSAGRNSRGKSPRPSFPRCHTMSVVRSPNGLNAPPAFAATTTFTQHIAANSEDVPVFEGAKFFERAFEGAFAFAFASCSRRFAP